MICWISSDVLMNLKAAINLGHWQTSAVYYTLQLPIKATGVTRKAVFADGIPCRRPASETSYIWSHGIRCGPASRSGLGSLTKMSPLQVTDQMAWWEGGPWIRRLSQQDMFSKDSYKTRSREPKASVYSKNKNFHRCVSITRRSFTSAGSCKLAKCISSFFSRALEFSVWGITNTITGTTVVCNIWSLGSIFQVFHRFSVRTCACLYLSLSTTLTTDSVVRFHQCRRTELNS